MSSTVLIPDGLAVHAIQNFSAVRLPLHDASNERNKYKRLLLLNCTITIMRRHYQEKRGTRRFDERFAEGNAWTSGGSNTDWRKLDNMQHHNGSIHQISTVTAGIKRRTTNLTLIVKQSNPITGLDRP